MASGVRAVSKEPALSLTVERHTPNPRVRLVMAGKVDGDAVVAAFIGLYAEEPAAVFYDRLIDLTAYRSGFELKHLQRIQAAYAAAAPTPGRPSRTAFVTRDVNFRLWVASMAYQFSGREFRAFDGFDEAEVFLAVPLAERNPAANA